MKKVYSELSQAYQFAVMEKGTPDNWGISNFRDEAGNINTFEAFEPYLKFIKVCNPDNITDCIKKEDILNVKGGILSDGTKIYMFGRDGSCNIFDNVCGDISVYCSDKTDLRFWIKTNGIVPKGLPNESDADGGIYTFENCLENAESIKNMPESCTAWIIMNENLDFLHCKDLSWDGKTKCKKY